MPSFLTSDPLINSPAKQKAIEFSPTFEVFGPAVFNQGKTITAFDAASDLATLGVLRGSKAKTPVGAMADALFREEEMTPISEVLSPEEANEKFGIDSEGNRILNFTKPISSAEAMFTREKKIREIKNEDVKRRIDGITANIAAFAIETLPEFVDPMGFGSLFVPFFRGSSFKRGFAEGAGSVALSLTPGGIVGEEMQSTFDSQQLVLTIIAGGTLSGLIGSAVGAASRTLDKAAVRIHERKIAEFAEEAALKEKYHHDMDPQLFEVAMRELIATGKVSVIDDIILMKESGQTIKAINDLRLEVTRLLKLRESATTPEDVSLINGKILETQDNLTLVQQKQSDLIAETAKKSQDPSLDQPKDSKLSKTDKVRKVREKLSPEQRKETLGRIGPNLDKANAGDLSAQQLIRNQLAALFSFSEDVVHFVENAPYRVLAKILKKENLVDEEKLLNSIRLTGDFGRSVAHTPGQLKLFDQEANSDILIKDIKEHQVGDALLTQLKIFKNKLKDGVDGGDVSKSKPLDDTPEPVSSEDLQALKDKYSTDQVVHITDITGEESTLQGLKRQLDSQPGDEDYVKLDKKDTARIRKIIRILEDQETDLAKAAKDEQSINDTGACLASTDTFNPSTPNI